MTIVTSRGQIQGALDVTKNTLLVISGAADSETARAVHDKASEVLEPWHRVLWIQDLALLNQDQKEQWLAMGGRYAVVARKTREPAKWGYLKEFLLQSGRPSGLKIAAALNAGD